MGRSVGLALIYIILCLRVNIQLFCIRVVETSAINI